MTNIHSDSGVERSVAALLTPFERGKAKKIPEYVLRKWEDRQVGLFRL